VTKDYIFEEITAKIQLRFSKTQEIIDDIGTLWDAYGKETSVEAAIENAEEYTSKRGIGFQSDIEVVVIKIVEQVRKRFNKKEENPYDPNFYEFKRLEWGSKANLLTPVETIVWSSKQVPT
jgi:hypothetical protein